MRARLPSTKLALIALSVVAAMSLARCFVGPGEVVPAIVAGLAANLSVLLATSVGSRYRLLGVVIGIVGALAGFATPMWFSLASATTFGWPTLSTLHLVGVNVGDSWQLFNQLRSPVPETAGFTLIGAWSVTVAALLAGWAAVDGDTSLWVVAPPAAIFLFTSALGTSSWRGEAIAAEVAALAWYAVASRSARLARNPILAVPITRTGARAGPSAGPGHAGAGLRPRQAALPATLMVLVAALLAATIGPRLPGAVSPALVSLRAIPGGDAASNGLAKPPPLGQVEVSTLVQVAEEEIYQSSTTFFTVVTAQPSYMVLTTLDTFDGDRWSTTTVPRYAPLPPAPVQFQPVSQVPGTVTVQSTISIGSLGGSLIPATPTPAKGNGSADLSYDSQTETVQADTPLEPNMLFYVSSDVSDLAPSLLAPKVLHIPASLQRDLQLPAGVPQSIVNLAHSIVKGDTTPYAQAAALQHYFQSGSFTYNLPKAADESSSVVTGGEGLADLVNFLFTTKSGFCQQYASAYAVLARIDDLPTRIAVGFVPGSLFATNDYSVTGTDVHAWPQVYLGGNAGWVNFEPTPGSNYPYPSPPTTPSKHKVSKTGGTSGKGGSTTTPNQRPHNERPPSGGTVGKRAKPAPAKPPSHGVGAIGGLGLLYGLVGLGLVILSAAPLERVFRRRRARSPSAWVLVAWRAAISSLGLVGLFQHQGESFNDLAQRVAHGGALADSVSADLSLLAGVSTVAAFSSTPPSAESVRQALAASRRVGRAARRRAGPRKALWSFVSPRGLLDRAAY